jgi:hypothetical protein
VAGAINSNDRYQLGGANMIYLAGGEIYASFNHVIVADLAINTTALNPGTVLTVNGGVAINGLPSADPGAGTNRLWYDPSDGNRVKYSP